MSIKLGERLVKDSIASEEQIKHALEIQQRTGGRLGDILLAITSMRALDYYQALARHYDLPFINLLKNPVDESLLIDADKDIYLNQSIIPLKKDQGQLTLATANPSPETFSFIKKHWGKNTEIVCTSKYDILYVLQKRFSVESLDHSINDLIQSNAALSSKYTLSRWQLLFLVFSGGLLLYYASVKPGHFFLALNIFLMCSVAGIIFYKILLSLLAYAVTLSKEQIDPSTLAMDKLPIYSILIPLFKENEITLRNLFINIQKIDYPHHLLDIKILLEEDDSGTIAILKKLHLPSYFEFIYVPKGFPRTKAKACNYGLQFARGEYLTLYDAEDKPDPLQLRIALQAFKKYEHERLACVQSHLNFYNIYDNWLTKMFTIEYTYWFDLLLPALEYLRTPLPLGGTSNHFKTSALLELHAWDPFNVTEDADLGIRLERMGYSSRVISSTTYEEANCQLGNWIKQRTRWVKGYIQTYIVHMRNPLLLWRTLGTRGYIGFHFFVGGTILTNLANLVLWIICGLTLIPGTNYFSFLFPPRLYPLAQLNFMLGSLGIIILNLLGVARRKNYKLLLVAFTSPLYWLLMSFASYRALYQLIFSPSVWEKTEHGISKSLQNLDLSGHFPGEAKMNMSQFFAHEKIKFGTSGIRANNSELTDKVCYLCTLAFLQHLEQNQPDSPKTKIAVAGDLRVNTEKMLSAIMRAITDKGYELVYLGKIPTPALAYYCSQKQAAGIMITGSHIEAHMNGIKFYLPQGEILKQDEEAILKQLVDTPKKLFSDEGSFLKPKGKLPKASVEGRDLFVKRYLDFFPAQALKGLRIGVYQHSSVAAAILTELLESLGADVVPFGQAKHFQSVDTEALSAFDISLAKEKISELNLDSIVSTDGDGDRALISNEKGNWIRGDTVGLLSALILEANYVVIPVSCNSSIDRITSFKAVIRTKIGSPYVIAGISQLIAEGKSKVIGYEANGGLLLGTSFEKYGHTLASLPTRDSILPLLTILSHINEQDYSLSALANRYLIKYTESSGINNFPIEKISPIISNKLKGAGYSELINLFSEIGSALINTDFTDGLRLYYENGDIIHLRASGNSPVLRVYTEANSEEKALRLNQACRKILEKWTQTVTEAAH